MRHRSLISFAGLAIVAALFILQSGCKATSRQSPLPTIAASPTPTVAATSSPTPPLTPTPTPTLFQPIVEISPSTGSPGTLLTVSATGFQPNATVVIAIGREGGEAMDVATPKTDDEGALLTQLSLPVLAMPGEEWVVVIEAAQGSAVAISNPFLVAGVQALPEVTLSPVAGPAGTVVRVIAVGLPPNQTANIGIGRPGSEYDVLTSAQTNAQGEVATDIVIPDFVTATDNWVVVVEVQRPTVRMASAPFDVTATGPQRTPTPVSGGFTEADVYLIALGDNGQSGLLVGCGDSAVPVVVHFAPTVAPLRASLEQLLAIKTQYYGESGLYDALYQSELTVGAIDIEQGTATIALSGSLVLGGTCDAPRVKAQIEQTALQFSTVSQVSVFINGQPLEEVLSSR